MILLQISGTPYPLLRSFVNNAGVLEFPGTQEPDVLANVPVFEDPKILDRCIPLDAGEQAISVYYLVLQQG